MNIHNESLIIEKRKKIRMRRLGQLLVEEGIITQLQLDEALEVQKKKGDKLASILVDLGYTTADEIAKYVAIELKLKRFTLTDLEKIDEGVKNIIPFNIIGKRWVLPLWKEDNTLIIAMVNPFDVATMDEISARTGCRVVPIVATEPEIEISVRKIYGELKAFQDSIDKIDIHIAVEGDEKQVVDVAGEETDSSIISLVNNAIKQAIQKRASDIHFEPAENILRCRYRIDGELYDIGSIPRGAQRAVITRIKVMSNLDITEHRLPQDGRCKIKYGERDIDIRISIMPTNFGEKAVLRLLDPKSLCVNIEHLGFEENVLRIYKKCMQIPYGMFLVTGPTGSGKTTTLYSTLRVVSTPKKNVLTIEDPVEYVLEGINQTHVRADIGLTFAVALRHFLRQDPDVIMIGEIRDKETAEVSVEAALTGHLVLATLHTNDAASTLIRLRNMGIEPFLLASTIRMTISQRLARKICIHCKEPYEITAQTLRSVGIKNLEQLEYTLYRGKGCDRCNDIGTYGRIGIYELLVIEDDIRQLIIEGATSSKIKETARKEGMFTLQESAWNKVLAGIITVEEMLKLTFEESMEIK